MVNERRLDLRSTVPDDLHITRKGHRIARLVKFFQIAGIIGLKQNLPKTGQAFMHFQQIVTETRFTDIAARAGVIAAAGNNGQIWTIRSNVLFNTFRYLYL